MYKTIYALILATPSRLLFILKKCERYNSNIPFNETSNILVCSNSSPLQNQFLLHFWHMKQSWNKLLLLSCFNQQVVYCIVSFSNEKKKSKPNLYDFKTATDPRLTFFVTHFYRFKLYSRRILKHLSVCFE